MNARLSLSLLAAAVLVGGLALKLLSIRTAEVDPAPPVIAAASAFLHQQGFNIVGTRQNLDLTLVGAKKDAGCRMVLANMAPQGWHGGVVRKMADGGAQLFFVYDGAVFPDQPVMQARFQLYLSLLLRHLGFPAPVHPLFGVIADKACGAESYPWAELASIPLKPE